MGNLLPSMKEHLTILVKDAAAQGWLKPCATCDVLFDEQVIRPGCFMGQVVMNGQEGSYSGVEEREQLLASIYQKVNSWAEENGLADGFLIAEVGSQLGIQYAFDDFCRSNTRLDAGLKTIEWLDGNEENPCK